MRSNTSMPEQCLLIRELYLRGIMPRYDKRTDENQKSMVNELRSYGFMVKVTSSMGQGFPDVLVAKDRVAMGVEIKVKGKKEELTDAEIEMRSWWDVLGMKYVVAESVSDVMKAFEELRDKRLKKHKPIK